MSRHPGRPAAAIAAGSAVWTFLFSLFGSPSGYTLGDGIVSADGARWIAHGGAGEFYKAAPTLFALPAWQTLIAPVVRLGDSLGLHETYPRPQMWLLIGPLFAAAAATAVIGVDLLARERGVSRRYRYGLDIFTGAVLVPGCADLGHPEDAVALFLLCLAVSRFHRGRWQAAALWLSAGICFQLWVGTVLVYFVAASPAGQRAKMAFRASAVPFAAGLTFLAANPAATYTALSTQPLITNNDYVVPRLPWSNLIHPGHYLNPQWILVVGTPESPSRAVATIAAAVICWKLRKSRSLDTMFAVMAAVGTVRAAGEVEFLAYFALLGIVGTLLVTAAASLTVRAYAWLGVTVIAGLFSLTGTGSFPQPVADTLILASCAVMAVSAAAARRQSRTGELQPQPSPAVAA